MINSGNINTIIRYYVRLITPLKLDLSIFVVKN